MDVSTLLTLCGDQDIAETVLALEAKELKLSRQAILTEIGNRYEVMRTSIQEGMAVNIKTPSGLAGDNAFRLAKDTSALLLGDIGKRAMVMALAVAEQNARMGRIVATPTAGACGILPAVVVSVSEAFSMAYDKQVKAILTASIFGRIIAENATISGAQGGCQAECGTASAMAAAACVYLMDGSAQMCADAAALAIKFVMGLVCDPVAGLVEVPCVKRNASGAVNALCAAQLALAGIKSAIPCDEVISAMNQVGKMLDPRLKETSKGGLAVTPTACACHL